MSTVYQGRAGNITPPTALTITGATNASPSQITVSGALPAAFLSGVTVDITGTQGATGINGVWTATVTGASTFTIPNGLAPGVWTSGGSVQPLYLQAQTIPADGDVRSAASVNVPLESLADCVALIAANGIGAYKLQNVFFFASKGAGDFSTTGACGVTAGLSTGDWTGTIASLMPFAFADLVTGIPVIAGDLVVAVVCGSMLSISPASSNRFVTTLWYANYAPPATGSPTFTAANVPGAEIAITTSTNAATPFTIVAPIVMLNTGYFDFKIRYSPNSATTTANDVKLDGGITAIALVLRATAIPQ
jgi:hypothetical protein